MQVKSLLKRDCSHTVQTTMDWVIMDIQQKGSALLQTWAGLPSTVTGGASGNDVCLGSTELGQAFGGSAVQNVTTGRWMGASRADVLFILGGRGSILHWLKLQRNQPKVRNTNMSQPLFMTVLRKKQLLDKNLTVLAIHPRGDVVIEGKGWTGTAPTDMTKFNYSKISEYTPLEIADIAEKIFPSA